MQPPGTEVVISDDGFLIARSGDTLEEFCPLTLQAYEPQTAN